jgi:hypothetical protein
MKVLFDVHGVGVSLEGDTTALEGLTVHFAGFQRPRLAAPPLVQVGLERAKPTLPVQQRWRADQVLERGIVYNQGHQTWVDHHGVALSHYDYQSESGEVTALETADLIELGYLMVHSRLGVMLERRGLVRAHGVGFALQGSAGLVLTPSGGGKSRLAIALLRQPGVSLLSDDMVLLDAAGQAHPFPHPIGISDPQHAAGLGRARAFVRRHHGTKWVIELGELLSRHQRGPLPLRLLVMASRVNRPPSRVLGASRRMLAGALWRDVVVGLGLPQVLELIARAGARDLWRQAPSALMRARVAGAALRRARPVRLDIADPGSAAEVLVTELRALENLVEP